MKATYNEKNRQFNLIYFDAVKELNGHPYPHSRKQETWKGDKKPTQKQIKQKIAELELLGETLQKERALEAERMKQYAFEYNTYYGLNGCKQKSLLILARELNTTHQSLSNHIQIYKEYLKLQNLYLPLQPSCLSIYILLKRLCREYRDCKAYREEIPIWFSCFSTLR